MKKRLFSYERLISKWLLEYVRMNWWPTANQLIVAALVFWLLSRLMMVVKSVVIVSVIEKDCAWCWYQALLRDLYVFIRAHSSTDALLLGTYWAVSQHNPGSKTVWTLCQTWTNTKFTHLQMRWVHRQQFSEGLMTRLPSPNEPVYLLNVPNECFWSISPLLLLLLHQIHKLAIIDNSG